MLLFLVEMSTTNVERFCSVLAEFKRELLEKETLKSQNVGSLDDIVKILLDLYSTLYTTLLHYRPFSTIEIPAVRKLFEVVPPPSSPEEKEKMLYYAKLNLVTFPFTLDQQKLTEFPITNTMEGQRYSLQQ
jgi:hypothetical protein